VSQLWNGVKAELKLLDPAGLFPAFPYKKTDVFIELHAQIGTCLNCIFAAISCSDLQQSEALDLFLGKRLAFNQHLVLGQPVYHYKQMHRYGMSTPAATMTPKITGKRRPMTPDTEGGKMVTC
jgi:hypothetical protein